MGNTRIYMILFTIFGGMGTFIYLKKNKVKLFIIFYFIYHPITEIKYQKLPTSSSKPRNY